jgi:hypothetical protein
MPNLAVEIVGKNAASCSQKERYANRKPGLFTEKVRFDIAFFLVMALRPVCPKHPVFGVKAHGAASRCCAAQLVS